MIIYNSTSKYEQWFINLGGMRFRIKLFFMYNKLCESDQKWVFRGVLRHIGVFALKFKRIQQFPVRVPLNRRWHQEVYLQPFKERGSFFVPCNHQTYIQVLFIENVFLFDQLRIQMHKNKKQNKIIFHYRDS